jgi:putative transcriptional regulator
MRSVRRRPPEQRDGALCNSVRELRTAAELTQAVLAERVGVTRQTIIAIERGGYVPSVALALLLARELSEPVERVFWLGPSEGERA